MLKPKTMKTLKLNKKDPHTLVPMEGREGEYELYIPQGSQDMKELPEKVEIGTGANKQELFVNVSAPVKNRHLLKSGDRLVGDHHRLFVMNKELHDKIAAEIENEQK